MINQNPAGVGDPDVDDAIRLMLAQPTRLSFLRLRHSVRAGQDLGTFGQLAVLLEFDVWYALSRAMAFNPACREARKQMMADHSPKQLRAIVAVIDPADPCLS